MSVLPRIFGLVEIFYDCLSFTYFHSSIDQRFLANLHRRVYVELCGRLTCWDLVLYMTEIMNVLLEKFCD